MQADTAVQRSGLVAGCGILVLAVLAAAANFGAINAPTDNGDAGRTARDILASAGQFRLGIAALLLVAMLDVLVAWALFTFFQPVHGRLAMLAAWFRLAYAVVFAVAISQLVGILPVLTGPNRPTSLTAEQRNTEALLKLLAFHDIWSISLAFFGVHLILIGVLAWQSGYVPRPLGVLLVIAGGGYLLDTFVTLLRQEHSVQVSGLTFVGEALFMIWLLARGRRVRLPSTDPAL